VASRRQLRAAAILVGLAVSAFFTYLAVREVDFERFRQGLGEMDYRWLLPALLALASAVFLRAVRWRLLFAPAGRPPLGAVTNALLIGQMLNQVLPARAGEAARVVALHQEAGTSRAEAVGTAVTERIYDVVSLLVLLFVAAPFLPEVSWLRGAAIFAAVLTVLIVAGILLVERYRERPLRFLLRPFARVPGMSRERMDAAALNIVEGLAALRRPRMAALAFGATLLSWLVIAVSFWLVVVGFDLGVGFGAALLMLVATNLALVIPALPAGLGIFEAATILALGAYGIDDSRALSCAVVLHALNLFPFLAAGLFVLQRHTLVLRRDRVRPPAPARDRG